MIVQRYIHQNPLKAKLVEDIAKYKWSSYSEYINVSPILCKIDTILDLYDSHKQFIEFTEEKSKDNVMDGEWKIKYTDEEVISIKRNNFTIVEKYDKLILGDKND